MEKPKILIAIPNMGTIDTRLVQLLLKWTAEKDERFNLSILAPIHVVPHDNARNLCIDAFLNGSWTHILFIDSDVIPPSDAVEKLLETRAPFVSGVYHAPKNMEGVILRIPHVYMEGKKEMRPHHNGSGVEEVAGVGAGCMLVERGLIEAVRKAHGSCFRFRYDDHGKVILGEDFDFCSKVRQVGQKIMVNHDVQCLHNKTVLA